jgi:hypothetical protein
LNFKNVKPQNMILWHEGSKPEETVVATERLVNTFPLQRIHERNSRGTIWILVMDLEESEARNDCAVEDQRQFNIPTEAEKTYCVL